jgi:hypothetical protein
VSTAAALVVDPARFENPVNQGVAVLAALRGVGVPAIGVLGVTGVEYGTLSIGSPDLESGEVTYSWSSD